MFDTFRDEMYIWIKHLQAKVSSSENSSDLLTFVSKILTMYIANPYPYMDRVSDLMSEAVGLESGVTTVDTNRQKLEKKMEGINIYFRFGSFREGFIFPKLHEVF